MSNLIHIAERVLNRPLLLHPDKLALIASVLEGRIGIDATELRELDASEQLRSGPDASRFVGSAAGENGQGSKAYRVHKGVAIIPILGSLVNRGAWVGARSGMTSYEGIGFQLDQAAVDPDVKSVLLDIDSPGGEAVGCFEVADKVRSLAKSKSVTALVNGMAASAAYAIASAASSIVSTPSGVSGSVGVVLMHADYSNALHMKGVKPTLIHAGAHKVDGNPYEPLSASVRADLQAEVDQFYSLFVSGVAKGRKGRMTDRAIRSTEARTYIGAAALEAGLVDAIGSFETVLADLSQHAPKSKSPSAPARQSSGLAMEVSAAAVLAVPPLVGSGTASGAGLGPGPGNTSQNLPALSFPNAEIVAAIDAFRVTPDPAAIAEGLAMASLKGIGSLPLGAGWADAIETASGHRPHSPEPGWGWGAIVADLNSAERALEPLVHGWSEVVGDLNATIKKH